MSNIQFADLAIWFPAFLLSLTVHEAAHAWVSRRYGDFTAEQQVTLNPIPHIRQEPIGTIAIPLLVFFLVGGKYTLGWASTPYDPLWARRNPRASGLMSLAGPMSNFLVAGIALGIIWALVAAGQATITPWGWIPSFVTSTDSNLAFLGKFLSVLYFLNILLGVFNLIPVPPLDGAGIIQGFFPRSGYTRIIETYFAGGMAFVGILIAWLLFRFVGIKLVYWIGFQGLGVDIPMAKL